MTLIGILLALGLERVLGHVPGWGRPVLFMAAMNALRRLLPTQLWSWALVPVLVVVPPVVLVVWGFGQIDEPLVEISLSAAILLLCLGPRDLAEDVHELIRAREAGDEERAGQLARMLQRGPNPGETHRSLMGALFVQSHEKLFGVLLWFFAAGPAGAVGYRLISRLPRWFAETAANSPAHRVAEGLHGAAAWLPARITAALFGLAGSLDDAMQAWRRVVQAPEHVWRNQTWAILAEVASASLRSETPDGAEVVPASLSAALGEVLRMQWRALLILLAFFAFFATGSVL